MLSSGGLKPILRVLTDVDVCSCGEEGHMPAQFVSGQPVRVIGDYGPQDATPSQDILGRSGIVRFVHMLPGEVHPQYDVKFLEGTPDTALCHEHWLIAE
jgi:hypothetical protein